MHFPSSSDRALRVFYLAHQFLREHDVHWLPVNPEDIINKHGNWTLKYVHQLAYEIGKNEQYVLDHVMRSQDGLSLYDVNADKYNIIINVAEGIPPGRILWTKMHEIGHIYLGHLRDNHLTEIIKAELPAEIYEQMEFEADMFAGEVLASKWLMRSLDVYDEKAITAICGISDKAAHHRYVKATADYQFVPANVLLTQEQFSAYCKEVTVCMDKSEMTVEALATTNPPRPKYAKPKAKFLRRKGECPYCGGQHSIDAIYCPYCGMALKTAPRGVENAEPCGIRQAADAAYCEKCGRRVYRTRQGFCFEECEI
mgnify:CR=1 FL=1